MSLINVTQSNNLFSRYDYTPHIYDEMKSEMLQHFEISPGSAGSRNTKRDTKGLRNPNQRKSSKKSRRKNGNGRSRGKNRDKSRRKDRKNHGNKQNGCSKERLFLNFKELGIDVSSIILFIAL